MQLDLGLNLGIYNSSSSAPVNWTPAELPNLALWLDAEDAASITLNGSTVAQWSDKSGNARHASQPTAANQPTYNLTGLNSKPGLVFDGVSDSIISPTASSVFPSTLTCALVMMPLSTATSRGIMTFATNLSVPFILQQQSTATAQTYYLNGGYRITETIAQNTPYITEISYTGTEWISWLNGTQGTAYTGPRGTTSSSNIHLGNGFTAPWNGIISEFVATTTALSIANRQRLEGYLAWKWGLVANLPSGHPFKNTPPTV